MSKKMPSLSAYPVSPMTGDATRLMLALILDKDGHAVKVFESDLSQEPFFKAYMGWVDAAPFKMTPQLKIFLFFVILKSSDCRPFGFDIFFINMAQYGSENNITEWTLSDFSEFLPFGYPTVSTMEQIWDAYKAS